MRPVQALMALVLLGTLFLIFSYSNLQLDVASGHRDMLRHQSHTVNERDAKAQSSEQEDGIESQLHAMNLSVSEKLKQTIPQNGAYWNRLLHTAAKNLDKGENYSWPIHEWSQCKEKSKELVQTNVHDLESYPPMFQDFLYGMNCGNPPVLHNQPNKCSAGGGEVVNQMVLLFGIKSIPAHFEERQAVRETWGREGVYADGVRVITVFLLGSSPPGGPDLSQLLSFEANQFGDVLQWDIHESLLNLTLKMNVFLRWTVKHCPKVSFIFSGDDDVFVNTPALISYFQSLEPAKASGLYVGHVIKQASPHRDKKSKYYIPVSFFDGGYPDYTGGGGFLISGALLQPLYLISRVIPLFPIDDVYIAMCLEAVGVSPEAHSGFLTFGISEKDRENLCIHKNLILIHRRIPQEIERLWNGITNPLLTC